MSALLLLLVMCAPRSAVAGLPAPVPIPGNRVDAVFALKGYLAALKADVLGAQKSIYLDYYVFGGQPAEEVARALVQRHQDGLDVRVIFDRQLGTVGALRREVVMIRDLLVKGGVPFRTAVTRKGTGMHRRVVDHNKLVVIDGKVSYVGGTNVCKVMEKFNDLMLRVDGPASDHVQQQFLHDWDLAGGSGALPQTDLTSTASGLMESTSEGDLSTVRVVGTGPGRLTFQGTLLNALASATSSIEVQLHQLNHDPVIDALIAAHNRGVAVRALLDPTNIDNFIPLIHEGPRGVFNAYAVTRLKAAGVPVKFVKVDEEFDAYHMKLGIFDGRVLLAGSANWDYRGNQLLTETDVEVAGGRAVGQVRGEFDRLWNTHAADAQVGYLARVINFLMRTFL